MFHCPKKTIKVGRAENMHRFFAEPDACKGEWIRLSGEDRNHIKNVLRLKTGEQITVCSGDDLEYVCEIVEFTETEVLAKVIDVLGSSSELPVEITLYQGLPKSDKMDFIIQKAVELGADRIVPVITKRTIVKLDPGKAAKRLKRYQAIAVSAAKQSKRSRIPKVGPIMHFSEALKDAETMDMNLIPYEKAKGMQYSREIVQQLPGKHTLGIFIGPEGGFAEEEIEAARAIGASCITLGRRILRTETAGLAVLSILMFTLEQDCE